MSKNSIFIQIASYRDPELVPTLDSLFDNAKFPNDLMVCIAWQHSTEDEWDDLGCLLYTSPSPRDRQKSRMPSSA